MYLRICIWLILVIQGLSQDDHDFNIQGSTAEGWSYVRDLFKENFLKQRDLGASLAIYHHGELVVDLRGGWFDQAQLKPYDDNTLQLVFSTTKGLVAIAVALCVQRGLLDYSALVTKYWPEYGQNRKANTTVADIMSHRAGLLTDTSPFEQHLNWTAMIHTLEKQEPLWTPGTAHGYHALTYGWLAGELVRRVDPQKRSFGQFIRDEITKPLNIEFYVGLPPAEEYRVSPLFFTYNETEQSSPAVPGIDDVFNLASAHQAEIPAVNGIANARSVAKLYASLISDVDNGKFKRLLNEDIVKKASASNTPQNEIDRLLNATTQFGMGFILMNEAFPALGGHVFGHSGNFNYFYTSIQ